VTDAAGAEVLRHTEGTYDYAAKGEIRPVWWQRISRRRPRADDGDYAAWDSSRSWTDSCCRAGNLPGGLAKFPDSLELNRAAGRSWSA